jgi:hypothetical protein
MAGLSLLRQLTSSGLDSSIAVSRFEGARTHLSRKSYGLGEPTRGGRGMWVLCLSTSELECDERIGEGPLDLVIGGAGCVHLVKTRTLLRPRLTFRPRSNRRWSTRCFMCARDSRPIRPSLSTAHATRRWTYRLRELCGAMTRTPAPKLVPWRGMATTEAQRRAPALMRAQIEEISTDLRGLSEPLRVRPIRSWTLRKGTNS